MQRDDFLSSNGVRQIRFGHLTCFHRPRKPFRARPCLRHFISPPALVLAVLLGSGGTGEVVAAPEPAAAARPVLRVAYFIPADREPLPDRVARVDRVLTEVQRFYREGMEQNGYGPMTFPLDRRADGQLRIYEVRGREPMRAYGREDSRKVRDEVRAALARQGLEMDSETVIIFQLLLDWQGDAAIEIGPYCGGGDAGGGTAWVYDDAKLDPQLLTSRTPGGFYHRPCSLGEFNTHYLGGVAHELGHALGLPHDCERASETKRKGASLMGAGNHTYGQEQRGEGPGTFLTAAAALPLSVHPLFSGKRHPKTDLTCRLAELDAHPEPHRLTLRGQLADAADVVGVVAYSDARAIPADYDALGWTSRLEADGRFRLTIKDLTPGIYDLRLRAIGAHGYTKGFHFTFTVDVEGRAQVEPLIETVWIQRAQAAYRARDKARLTAIAAEAKRTHPAVTRLHQKLAHYGQLVSAGPPQALREIPPKQKRCRLADIVWESATTGWGPPLRNQVPAEGELDSLLAVDGQFFPSGLYAHAPARHVVQLDQNWKSLTTGYGLQDHHPGSVVFVIKGDGRELFRSRIINDHQPREQTVNLEGVSRLELLVEDAGDGRSGDWGVWLAPELSR